MSVAPTHQGADRMKRGERGGEEEARDRGGGEERVGERKRDRKMEIKRGLKVGCREEGGGGGRKGGRKKEGARKKKTHESI